MTGEGAERCSLSPDSAKCCPERREATLRGPESPRQARPRGRFDKLRAGSGPRLKAGAAAVPFGRLGAILRYARIASGATQDEGIGSGPRHNNNSLIPTGREAPAPSLSSGPC